MSSAGSNNTWTASLPTHGGASATGSEALTGEPTRSDIHDLKQYFASHSEAQINEHLDQCYNTAAGDGMDFAFPYEPPSEGSNDQNSASG